MGEYHLSDEFSIDLSMPVDKLSNKLAFASGEVGEVQVGSCVVCPHNVAGYKEPMGTSTTGYGLWVSLELVILACLAAPGLALFSVIPRNDVR